MRVLGLDGGVAALQKIKMDDGVCSSVEHDMAAHRAFSPSNRSSLSHAQKVFIAEECTRAESRDDFTGRLVQNTTCPPSDDQLDDLKDLKRVVYNFVRKNPKFCVGYQSDVMDLKTAIEALDLLKADPATRTGPAPVGASGSKYYETDGWTNHMWKYILVGSHDYCAETGILTNIVLHPIDVHKRAAMIASTFPDGVVQLEGDYFCVKRINSNWEVGHCGSSDYNRTYWVITWQIALSENEKLATKLFSESERLVREAGGTVTKFLVDGGTALQAAVNNVSVSIPVTAAEG